jgi:ferric-dicitrate binding protein FerR (iron transport regulator)
MNFDDPGMTDETPREIEALAGLIRSAGRRIDPPESARQQALAVALEAWREKAARVRRRRSAAWLTAGAAIAAGVTALALNGSLWRTPLDVPTVPVAKLERGIGTVETRPPGARDWQLLDDQAPLVSGARVRTAPGGRAAVRLASGVSLRLAENSEIVFATPPLIELAAGRAYVDNDGRQPGARVEIITSIANVTDVGTQFEVSLVGDQYRLRVRQGRVQLRHGMARIDGIAGDELTIRADGGVERSSISPTDDEWRWAEAIATAPEVNDRPVTELLNWVARETGRPIRFQDADVERRAGSIILHGSIRHLAPLDALSVMLATTDLDYVELADGTLLIQSRPAR